MKMNVFNAFLKKYLFLFILVAIFTSSTLAWAEGDQGYIYGKITLDNGNVYQGVIRWGDEEAFWDDMFNSTKVDNIFEEVLYDLDIDDLEDELYSESRRRRSHRRNIFNITFRDDSPGETEHQFKCRFGDIQTMRLRGRESILLTFKNGEEMRISGGSNDVGASLMILDDELDEVKLKWQRIETIEFMSTPKKLNQKLGDPLFGEVETRRGTFHGFIQWDHDECLSTDVLDGDSEDGDMKIRFTNIRSIEKYRRGSLVTLKSGREIYLTGSNDVNSENRGVVIKDPELGKILVKWRAFEKITFQDTGDSGPAYKDFQETRTLSGVVHTKDDETYSGRIIYDLDEIYDLEILDGQDGYIEYNIPFRNIKRISPRSSYGSRIELKNGDELVLEDSRDVDEDNDGIVVVEKKDKAKYIPWRDIREILFN
jgi:hypothetical protein